MDLEKKDKVARTLSALFITIFYLAAVYVKCGIFFETNDDRLIGEILSGTIVLKPDGHTVYVNYLLSESLSFLYTVFPQIAWYGLFLILAHGICYFTMLNEAFLHLRTKTAFVIGILVSLSVLISTLRILGNIQFTSTAALLAISGYLYLLLGKNDRRAYVLFAVFEILSFLLRSQSMLMIQAVGFPAYAGLLLSEKEDLKWKVKHGFYAVLIIIGIAAAGETADNIAYSGEEWREYFVFNETITNFFDFYGSPDYEEVKDILDRYGVSETEYNAFTKYVILDKDISAECMQELSAYVKVWRGSNQSREISEIFRSVLGDRFRGDYQGINHVSGTVWIIVLFCVLLQRKFRYLWSMAGIAIGEMAAWFYLYYMGRTPFRVMAPLFIAETVLLLSVFLKMYSTALLSNFMRVFTVVCCGVLFIAGYKAGKSQYRWVAPANAAHRVYTNGLYELEEYCRERPKNRYIIGQQSYSYYKGGALDAKIYRPRNSVLTGCWYSYSPPLQAYLQEYFSGEKDGVYLIVYDDEVQTLDTIAISYLQEKTHAEPVIADSFTLSHGGKYKVYYFEEELKSITPPQAAGHGA